jgi:hypothetical protein
LDRQHDSAGSEGEGAAWLSSGRLTLQSRERNASVASSELIVFIEKFSSQRPPIKVRKQKVRTE